MAEPSGSTGRLAWLERAIVETTQFCEETERDVDTELSSTRFDTWDYDFELDLKHQAEMARQTLALMEAERESILARKRMRDRRKADEEKGR